MAELQLVDFTLMPGPVGKEKQFGLPEDISKIYVTILSPMNSSGVKKLLWLDKGDYFTDKILLKLASLSSLLVLQTVIYLIGQN